MESKASAGSGSRAQRVLPQFEKDFSGLSAEKKAAVEVQEVYEKHFSYLSLRGPWLKDQWRNLELDKGKLMSKIFLPQIPTGILTVANAIFAVHRGKMQTDKFKGVGYLTRGDLSGEDAPILSFPLEENLKITPKQFGVIFFGVKP